MTSLNKTCHVAIPLEVSPTVAGRVWKGTKRGENRPGQDLKNKFRLELPKEYQGDFISYYGSLTPSFVRVFLPYTSSDEVFETWNEAYTAKGFKHRCNGETIVHQMVTLDSQRGGKSYKKPCRMDCNLPCQRKEGQDICGECQSQGRIKFLIRELAPRMGFDSIVMQTVTGINDVLGVTQQLRSLEATFGTLRDSPVPSPSTYGHIPFVMQRYEKEISIPLYDSKSKAYTEGRSRTDTYPILITVDPEWLDHLNTYRQRQHILQMVRDGSEGLLTPSDRLQLKEMASIALSPERRSLLLNASDEILALPESARDEIVEDIEQEALEPYSGVIELDQEAVKDLISRPNGQRLRRTAEALGLGLQDLGHAWKASHDGEEANTASAEVITVFVQELCVQWGARKFSRQVAERHLLHILKEREGLIVDEFLAELFTSTLTQSIPIAGRSPSSTVRGVSVD